MTKIIRSADREVCPRPFFFFDFALNTLFFCPNNNTFTMSDSEQYHIETSDAGASATIPMEAGQIKKGG